MFATARQDRSPDPRHRVLGPWALGMVVLPALFAHSLTMPRESSARLSRQDPEAAAYQWLRLGAGPALAGHAAALVPGDDATRRWISLGGTGEFGASDRSYVLELDGSGEATWSQFAASDSPRSGAGGAVGAGARLAVDPGEGVAYARCNCAPPGAWLLDVGAAAWSGVRGNPQAPLVGSLLTYDTGRDRALTVGGDLLGLGSLVSHTVAYDLSDTRAGSTNLPPAPFALIYQAADVDPRSGHWLAFGGQDADGVTQGALWRASLDALDQPGAWSIASAPAGALAPPARAGATLTFLGDHGFAVLFGGYRPGEGELSDAWLLDYRRPNAPYWTRLNVQLGPDGAPDARSGHVAAWDAVGDRLLVHGGLLTTGDTPRYFGDTWALVASGIGTPPTTATTTTSPQGTATVDGPLLTATPEPGHGDVYLPSLRRP